MAMSSVTLSESGSVCATRRARLTVDPSPTDPARAHWVIIAVSPSASGLELRGGEHRPSGHEPLPYQIDLQVQSLERARAEQDKVIGLAKYDLVVCERAAFMHDREPHPSLQKRAVGLLKVDRLSTVNTERLQHRCRAHESSAPVSTRTSRSSRRSPSCRGDSISTSVRRRPMSSAMVPPVESSTTAGSLRAESSECSAASSTTELARRRM